MIANKVAHWPAPKNISALATTRIDGFSKAPYDSNNLALHVEDNAEDVLKNRKQLIKNIKLPAEPVWLNQTHSNECIIADTEHTRDADAAISYSIKHPLVILTADCIPITLCDRKGTEIAAIHAGWKGLYNGIIKNTLDKMKSPKDQLMAWIGPAICQNCYETGEEIHQKFTNKYPSCSVAFKPNKSKWLCNLPQIAQICLQLEGVYDVYQSELCTFELKSEFFSYRRSAQTGRIGTFIWFNDQPREYI